VCVGGCGVGLGFGLGSSLYKFNASSVVGSNTTSGFSSLASTFSIIVSSYL